MHRRRMIALLLTSGSVAIMAPLGRLEARPLLPQDQAPSRRDLTVTVKDFRFTPDRLEVVQDDLVRVTIVSDDVAHSFNVDEYRIARRVPAKGRTVVEFRADRVGTFPFYCNLTSEPGHDQMRGQLVVRPK
jgi:heme/copper-type cytochrome/quinol oxidase subunit 2